MTAATKVEPEITVEALEDELEALRASLREKEQAVTVAQAKVDEAVGRGDDDATLSSLLDEATKAEKWREAIKRRIAEREELLPEVRESEASRAAAKEMVGDHRAFTSLLDQHDKKVQRLREAGAAYAEAFEAVNSSYTDDLTNRWLRMIVKPPRYGTAMPDVRMPIRPAADKRVLATLKTARSVTPADPPPLPRSLFELPYRGSLGGWNVRRVMERIQGTPTIELLKLAGAGILGNPEEWEQRRREENDRKAKAKDAARMAELERYDDWLRNALSEGPVPVSAIETRAEADGMRWNRYRNHPGASVREAADRLRVFGIVPAGSRESGTVHWTLTEVDGWVPLPSITQSIEATRH